MTSPSAALLRRRWLGEHVDLSPVERSLQGDLQRALALQLELAQAHMETGEHVAGWKVGMTSGANRDGMGVGYRPFGHILQSRVFSSGDSVPAIGSYPIQLEPEIGLVLGTPLGGTDVTTDEARRAVKSLHAAFEINEFRLPGGSGSPLVVADNLANWGLVLGAPVEVVSEPESTPVAVRKNSDQVNLVSADGLMDSPYLSLARLCRTLAGFGRSLEAGQVVLTGSFSHDVVENGDRWEARFVDLGGVVEASFGPAAGKP